MKINVLAIFLVFGFSAFADGVTVRVPAPVVGVIISYRAPKAGLQIPLVLDGGLSATSLNKILKQNRIKPLPEFIVLDADEHNRAPIFEALDQKIEDTLRKLGPDYAGLRRLREDYPGENNKFTKEARHETCYTGDAARAAHIVWTLGDLEYPKDFDLWGWKHGKETKMERDDADTARLLEQIAPDEWKQWNPKDASMIGILSNHVYLGKEVNLSLIKKCP